MSLEKDKERFWAKVNKTDDCWLWTASTTVGYGRFKMNGKLMLAHRLSWEWANGPIPEDKVVDHICFVRNCVNPNHMQLLSREDNSRRYPPGFMRHYPEKQMVCSAGHDISIPENRCCNSMSRGCRQCATEHRRAWRQKRREQGLTVT